MQEYADNFHASFVPTSTFQERVQNNNKKKKKEYLAD